MKIVAVVGRNTLPIVSLKDMIQQGRISPGNEAWIKQTCAKSILKDIREDLEQQPRSGLENIGLEDILRSKVFEQVFSSVGIKNSSRSVDLDYALEQGLVHRLVMNELIQHRMRLPKRQLVTDW